MGSRQLSVTPSGVWLASSHACILLMEQGQLQNPGELHLEGQHETTWLLCHLLTAKTAHKGFGFASVRLRERRKSQTFHGNFCFRHSSLQSSTCGNLTVIFVHREVTKADQICFFLITVQLLLRSACQNRFQLVLQMAEVWFCLYSTIH